MKEASHSSGATRGWAACLGRRSAVYRAPVCRVRRASRAAFSIPVRWQVVRENRCENRKKMLPSMIRRARAARVKLTRVERNRMRCAPRHDDANTLPSYPVPIPLLRGLFEHSTLNNFGPSHVHFFFPSPNRPQKPKNQTKWSTDSDGERESLCLSQPTVEDKFK